jgi:hypothetical protein
MVVVEAVVVEICQLFVQMLKSTVVGQLKSQNEYKTKNQTKLNDEETESELFEFEHKFSEVFTYPTE